PRQLLLAGLDDALLLISNAYRFLRFTPRQLLDLQAARLTVQHQVPFGKREQLCHVAAWGRERLHERLLLATTLGVVRPYPLPILRDNLETPVPLKFDHPLPGDVLAALGSNGGETLLLLTAGGRGLRLAVDDLRLGGLQAVNCGADDRVAAALLGQAADEALLVTADGYGRRLRLDGAPAAERPNSKGGSLIARRSPLVGAAWGNGRGVWLATTTRLLPLDPAQAPLADSTRTERLVKLEAGEVGVCLVAADKSG
ncbi:MAG: hypothetical protein KC425_04595, partial [Anaerolineales bacterium]|nr:hypothetical protein [Anaerolineales bacterium]